MSATPIEGRAPVVWFLTARDGGSAVRITPGLTLREDAAGRLKLGTRPDEEGWIRFDLEDDVPWVTVTSPEFALVSGKRVLGTRLRLDESLELVLPNTGFQISRSFADRGRAHRTEVRLIRVEPADTPPEGPPIRLLPALETTESLDIAAPLPAYAAAAPTVKARVPDAEPAHRNAAGRTTPRRWRKSALLAGALSLLLALPAVTPVQSPTAETFGHGATDSGQAVPAAQAVAEMPPLLTSVEALLSDSDAQEEGPSEVALHFAIEAYRMAASEQPENRALQARLSELRAQLAAR